MKPCNQSIVDKEDGDCTRACVATVLGLELDAIPHFVRYGSGWFKVLWSLLRALDYEFYGTGFPKGEKYPKGHILKESLNIDGFVIASVPSKTFTEVGHSVVMNLNGLIVHDPNPNKLWEGINVLESGELTHWLMIGPKGLEENQESPQKTSEEHIYYPDAYQNRIWHSSSLDGCTGYVEYKAEWCVADGDGGICIALCSSKEDADAIVERLNGKYSPKITSMQRAKEIDNA